VPNEELPALLRSATMLLVPSLYEPGSIVTAEALACGLPVVLSNEVGNAEVVSGPHARIHRAGDVDDLEASVRSLLVALEEDERTLRASARANAEAEFSPTMVVSQLIEMISRLQRVEDRGQPGRPLETTNMPYPATQSPGHDVSVTL